MKAKKKTEILFWRTVTRFGILTGALFVIFSYFLTWYYNIIPASGGQWILSLGIAITSIGLACLSIVHSLESEKRINDLEKKGINRKLSIFKEENNSNIQLIQNLFDRKKNWFPQKLLDKKLKQSKPQKYELTPVERKQIKGLWIPKEDFSYNYALQVIELSHFFEHDFIQKIQDYIKKGKKLNNHKYICQHWALSRGVPNPDETRDYYTALNDVKEDTDEMKELIFYQIRKLDIPR